MAKKILFIGHDASRSGAPMILLHLLRWIKAHTDLEFILLLAEGGDLEADYQKLCPALLLNNGFHATPGLGRRVLNHLERGVFNGNRRLRAIKRRVPSDELALIYSNTTTNGDVVEYLSERKPPVITHVHELEFIIRNHPGAGPFRRVDEQTTHFIAASAAVKQNLIRRHGVREEKIDVVHEFIPAEHYTVDDQSRSRDRVCDELGIPRDAFIVGGSGVIHWRKGPDLFVQLARAVNQRLKEKPAYFVWVGGDSSGYNREQLEHDVRHAGLEKHVRLLDERPNPLEYFAAFDVFSMVSREDPFPLVNLETAALGKPIVCFDNAGGSREFVEDDCGFVVPYLDIEAMADRIVGLKESPELCRSLGRNAALKVRERHDVSIAAPLIFELIQQYAGPCAGL